MNQNVSFEISEINNFINDENPELAIANVKFLSTSRNSHKINITEDILRRDASTLLGKFLVGRMNKHNDDCESHEVDEIIFGYFPTTQEIKFEKNKYGRIVASADAVVSKLYATSFYDIFSKCNNRNVSVEMTVDDPIEKPDGSTDISGLNITCVTVLGRAIKGSCPDAKMSITRFSEDKTQQVCEDYYKSIWERFEESELDKFVKDRKAKLEGKSYNVNTKELKETPWGDVDKTELRNVVMEANNRSELVKKVYLQVLDGWEDAPSENLKYPVMELQGNTFYYNRFALASALAYAKQHNETDVISKVIELYKKFDLVEEGEEKDMSSKKFEIENREALEEVIAEIKEHEGDDANVESVEEDHIIFTVGDACYRVEANFETDDDGETKTYINWDTMTECDQDMSDEEEKEVEEVEESETEDETAESEEEEEEVVEEVEESLDDEEVVEESEEEKPEDEEDMADDSEEEIKEDTDEVKELKDIIMQKDAELEELRKYKAEKEEAEKQFEVQRTLEEIKECVDEEMLEQLKEEGMACNLSDIDGWKNKAKSMAFDAKAEKKANTSMWSMSIPTDKRKESTNMWDSI